jgi:hypothetical protein
MEELGTNDMKPYVDNVVTFLYMFLHRFLPKLSVTMKEFNKKNRRTLDRFIR